jgi:hypothetical protein
MKVETNLPTIEFKVSDDLSVLLELGETLSKEDEAKFIDILDILSVDNPPIKKLLITNLRDLARQYRQPFVWENLHVAYILSQKFEQAKVIEKQMQIRFPNCLYARFLRSAKVLEEHRLSDFEECFDHHANLPMLFPDRKVFHVSEAKMFHFQWLTYCTLITDVARAETHFTPFTLLLDKNDPALLQATEFIKALRSNVGIGL